MKTVAKLPICRSVSAATRPSLRRIIPHTLTDCSNPWVSWFYKDHELTVTQSVMSASLLANYKQVKKICVDLQRVRKNLESCETDVTSRYSTFFWFWNPYLIILIINNQCLRSVIICIVKYTVYQLLGNDSVNTIPRKRTRATIGRPLLANGSVNKHRQPERGCLSCVVRVEAL
jgi:hypothetical protein